MLNTFLPALPKQWKKRMNGLIDKLKEQGLEPKPIEELDQYEKDAFLVSEKGALFIA